MASGHVGCREGKLGKSWYYTIPLPPGPDGKRRQEQRRGFKTKSAAQAAMRQRLSEIEGGALGGNGARQTLAQFAMVWLERIQHDVTPRTYDGYARALQQHVLPRIGHLRLDRLSPLDIEQSCVAALEAGTSGYLVRYNHRVLKSALRRAVDWGLLTSNPADKVRLPGRARELGAEERKVRALTDEEARRLLAVLEGPMWLAAVIALGTGLRRGEVLGLRWQDLDFEAQTLSVRQAVIAPVGKGVRVRLGLPKTSYSIRTFRVQGELLRLLREHRAQQAALRLVTPDWQDYDLVVCEANGAPIHPNRLSDTVIRVSRKAGLEGVRFHDLRHTFATNQLRKGVDVTAVSKQLGHASVSITLNIYSHVLPDMEERAAEVAAETLKTLLTG